MAQQRVLLLDDSASIRNVLKVYLMGLGYEFLEAGDGARALRLVRVMPVDLVIADIHMSPMDGISFVRELRGDIRAHVKDIPVMLLTGDKSEEVEQQGRNAGANSFLRKPVNQKVFLEAVTRLLQDNRKVQGAPAHP